MYGKLAQIFDIIMIAESIDVDIYLTNQEVVSYLLMIEKNYRKRETTHKKMINTMLIYMLHQRIKTIGNINNAEVIKKLRKNMYIEKAFHIIEKENKNFFELSAVSFIPLIEETIKSLSI